MTKLPVISGKKLLKTLKKNGFLAVRQKGSHVFVESKEGFGTAIPLHANEDLGKGILKSILSDLRLSIDDLESFLSS